MFEIVGTILLAVAIGLAVGLVAGLLGVGGGTVLLPVFRLVFGMDALGCTATSLFTIIPTSLSGAVSHIRNKTCVPKLGLALGLGGACTSSIGVWLAQKSPSWLVMAAAALVIAYSAFTMLRKALALPKEQGVPAKGGAANATATGEQASASSKGDSPVSPAIAMRDVAGDRLAAKAPDLPKPPNFTPRQLALGVLIGAVAGLASGFVGLGGGFLMVPMMLSVLNMPMKLTSGTSLIAIMLLATPATITQCLLGNVDLVVGIATACGSIPGAFIGAKLMKRVPERSLRFAFSGFLLVGAVLLVVREIGFIG